MRAGGLGRGPLSTGLDAHRPSTPDFHLLSQHRRSPRAALCYPCQANLGSRVHFLLEGDELPRRPSDRSSDSCRFEQCRSGRGGRCSRSSPSASASQAQGKTSGLSGPMSQCAASLLTPSAFSNLFSASGKIASLPCLGGPDSARVVLGFPVRASPDLVVVHPLLRTPSPMFLLMPATFSPGLLPRRSCTVLVAAPLLVKISLQPLCLPRQVPASRSLLRRRRLHHLLQPGWIFCSRA